MLNIQLHELEEIADNEINDIEDIDDNYNKIGNKIKGGKFIFL